LTLSYDAFSGLEPFINDPELADSLSHRDWTNADLVVVSDYGNLITALKFNHRPLGHEQSMFMRSD
jgi:hypothetical protein